MQDAIAIAVAIAAALWLARTFWRQLFAPSCGMTQKPGGADGFIPLGDLTTSAKKPGPSEKRPGS
jgi:hypothetical protein